MAAKRETERWMGFGISQPRRRRARGDGRGEFIKTEFLPKALYQLIILA